MEKNNTRISDAMTHKTNITSLSENIPSRLSQTEIDKYEENEFLSTKEMDIHNKLKDVPSEEWSIEEKSFMSGISKYHVFGPEIEERNDILENDESVDTEKEIKVNTSQSVNKKKSKKTKNEEQLRAIIRQIDEKSRNLSLRNSLKSYLHACIYSDSISKGHSTLLQYRSKYLKRKELVPNDEEMNPIDVSVYNVLIKGWAKRANTCRIKEILKLMKIANVEPNSQSYAYYLLSLSRQFQSQSYDSISSVINDMKKYNIIPEQLLNECSISVRERDQIIKLLQIVHPHYKPDPPKFDSQYNCTLMDPINKVKHKYFNPSEGVDLNPIHLWSKQQFGDEIRGNVKVKSIALVKDHEKTPFYRQQWEESEKEWKQLLNESFTKHVQILQYQSNAIDCMTMYPYLTVMDPQLYIDAAIEEIRMCVGMSEYYSPTLKILHSNLGRKIMIKYFIKAQIRDGTIEDVEKLYEKYIDYYKTPELIMKYNPREYWHKLMIENNHHYNNDLDDRIWPDDVQIAIGQFLYNLILCEVKVNINALRSNASDKRLVPAFFITYKSIGDGKYKQEIRAHHTLIKLHQNACFENLIFDVSMLPMVSPPIPWISPRVGGYLSTKTDFVRFPFNFKWSLGNTKNSDIYPCYDSLNSLSLCPWIVNKKVLDLAIELFNNKGDMSLAIPKNQSEFPLLPKITAGLSKTERMNIYRQREIQKREMAEMYSLWCDCLYKLSIANNYRDKVFWFPNNLDFRGRVYPVPPHFNHLGNDLSRGILLFAKGQPLGKNGFDWLKIHLVNLTGLKKKSSVNDRLKFANEMMPLILDSADRPFDGEKWWTKSDEPWQTLACCIEIANVHRCPDPCTYISHYPVHQDGSCNGLQHYAALGRDQHGAQSVNLNPSDLPHDVYSDVAAIVERERAKDAADGNEIAQLLDGLISRKVVKQTVMTYVYGVTRFGARLQILRRLKEIDDFPKAKAWTCASYLTMKTFLSIQEMFTETRSIQDWLTDCARVISKIYAKPVQWVTPLGFPVIQPYYKTIKRRGETFFGMDNEIGYSTYTDMFQKPNTVKQKNAFPPNFIHSLDSSHMMLTSLHCQREGITFASVHDCFWTHPNCVEIMNRICRTQFVALHNEPILDDISKYFVNHYKDALTFASKAENKRGLLLLERKLNKGSFKLENVLNSTYFFS